MMTKKKLAILIGFGAFAIISLVIIYRSYWMPPPPFPTNDEMIEEINKTFPKASVSLIQAAMAAGDRHMLVPFISRTNDYGLSYWGLNQGKWKVMSIHTKGSPWVWKIKQHDPSTYYLVWNIAPEDQVDSISFYLLRNRGYQISGGTDHYYNPRVQMEENVSLHDKSYGAMQLPNDWVEAINAFTIEGTARQTDWFGNLIQSNQYIDFRWMPRDQLGNEVFTEASVNGSSFSNGKIHLNFVMYVNEKELEQFK